MFKKQPINCLYDNIVEMLKVSQIEQLLDNIIYKSNPQNDKFDDLNFGDDESLITRQRIYCIHNDIVFMLKNGSRVYV